MTAWTPLCHEHFPGESWTVPERKAKLQEHTNDHRYFIKGSRKRSAQPATHKDALVFTQIMTEDTNLTDYTREKWKENTETRNIQA